MEDRKKVTYLHNLIAIANSDGDICERELVFLRKKAVALGFSEPELEALIHYADEFSIVVPLTFFEKRKVLIDCVEMAMMDGKLTQKEFEMCKKVCAHIGLDGIYLHEAITLKQLVIT